MNHNRIDAAKIVALRNAGLNSMQIAERLGVNRSTVSHYYCQSKKKNGVRKPRNKKPETRATESALAQYLGGPPSNRLSRTP